MITITTTITIITITRMPTLTRASGGDELLLFPYYPYPTQMPCQWQ
jgi:hypothetical protein